MLTRDGHFLNRLADAAAAAILPYFRTPMAVDDKGGGRFDPVTAADRGAEAAMRAEIEAAFPEDGIHGEEAAGVRLDAEHVWVLDPIDGTRSFISGVPLWGTLIGLLSAGRPRLGLAAQPFIGERFFGDGESAAYVGSGGTRPLATRPCPDLSQATLFATTPDMFDPSEAALFREVGARARLTRFGCDCYAYCMLAAGFVDVVMEAGLKPYDIVALIPIIEGAGGKVTDWQGQPATAGGQVLASGDPHLHESLLRLISR